MKSMNCVGRCESVFLCVSTCVLCGSGLSQQSLKAQTYYNSGNVPEFSQKSSEKAEFWAGSSQPPRGPLRPPSLWEGMAICGAKLWYRLYGLVQQWPVWACACLEEGTPLSFIKGPSPEPGRSGGESWAGLLHLHRGSKQRGLERRLQHPSKPRILKLPDNEAQGSDQW